MDQDTTWYMEVRLGQLHTVLDGDLAPPQGSSSTPKRGHSSPPLFGPCLLWQWLDGSRCQFVRRR